MAALPLIVVMRIRNGMGWADGLEIEKKVGLVPFRYLCVPAAAKKLAGESAGRVS
jgi:hypothetical protein